MTSRSKMISMLRDDIKPDIQIKHTSFNNFFCVHNSQTAVDFIIEQSCSRCGILVNSISIIDRRST